MRKLSLLTAVTSALLASVLPVCAADMALKAPAPAAGIDWSGFYVGIHGGGLWGDTTISTFSFSNTGFIWGGQAGHNWQYRNFVVGLEADVSRPTHRDTVGVGNASIASQLDYLASVRARVGYLLTPDVLAFVGGGAGFGHGQITTTGVNLSAVHFGPVAGGGLEYMISRNFTVRAEVDKYWLGGASYTIVPGTVNPTVARVAVNLKF